MYIRKRAISHCALPFGLVMVLQNGPRIPNKPWCMEFPGCNDVAAVTQSVLQLLDSRHFGKHSRSQKSKLGSHWEVISQSPPARTSSIVIFKGHLKRTFNTGNCRCLWPLQTLVFFVTTVVEWFKTEEPAGFGKCWYEKPWGRGMGGSVLMYV
jgi:hypothetical protein